jgi:hypothetical protein
LVPAWKEFSLDSSGVEVDRLISEELDYIRNGRPHSEQQRFKTKRKYFVYDLANPDNDL